MKLFTVREASHILSCHPNTVRNLIARGELKSYKVGRLVRVLLEPFDRAGKGGSHDVHN